MTIHQLYDGGPANSTLARTQWPAYPFSASDPAFSAVDVAVHNGTPYAQLRRTLDFKNDYALQNYFKNNAVAVNDLLNVLLLPARTLLTGLYVEVEAVNDSGTANTFTFGTAAGLVFGGAGDPVAPVAIDATVLSSNFSTISGPWVNGTAGGAPIMGVQYIGTYPDMVQIKVASLANLSLAGFGALRLNVAASVVQLGEHRATNF